MPRYFFNTRIGDEIIPDEDGEELRDPDQAWEAAKVMHISEALTTEGESPVISAYSPNSKTTSTRYRYLPPRVERMRPNAVDMSRKSIPTCNPDTARTWTAPEVM